MTIKREYRCDLCGDVKPNQFGSHDLIGLRWSGSGTIEEVKEYQSVEHHICFKCLTSLQAFTPICGGGMRGCKGGPRCQSDHK